VTRLFLVRHGAPVVDPSQPAHGWPLAADGSGDIVSLRSRLPGEATWASSPEPKALATARLLTDRSVAVVADLREALRPATWYDAARFEALVRRSVLEPDVPADEGWEPTACTRARVVAAVRELLTPGPDHLVLVGHGTAWILLVAALTGSDPDLDAWAAMKMPDLAELDVHGPGPALLRQDWASV